MANSVVPFHITDHQNLILRAAPSNHFAEVVGIVGLVVWDFAIGNLNFTVVIVKFCAIHS